MKPRRTPTSNAVYSLPGGNEDNDLWLERTESEEGDPVLVSAWVLTDEERERIAGGANLQLAVWGRNQPPVSLDLYDGPVGHHG